MKNIITSFLVVFYMGINVLAADANKEDWRVTALNTFESDVTKGLNIKWESRGSSVVSTKIFPTTKAAKNDYKSFQRFTRSKGIDTPDHKRENRFMSSSSGGFRIVWHADEVNFIKAINLFNGRMAQKAENDKNNHESTRPIALAEKLLNNFKSSSFSRNEDLLPILMARVGFNSVGKNEILPNPENKNFVLRALSFDTLIAREKVLSLQDIYWIIETLKPLFEPKIDE